MEDAPLGSERSNVEWVNHGRAEIEADAVDDDLVRSLRSRVSVDVDPDLPYDSHEATLRIEVGGRALTEHRVNPPGTHDDPPSETERRVRFEECSERALTEDRIRMGYRHASPLRTADDLAAIVSALPI